jgi:hypothetical protein
VTDDRPFDAVIFLLDPGERASVRRWSTTSLVTGVRGLVSLPLGWPERGVNPIDDALKVACGALTERGIDADALIRFGFMPELVAAVVIPTAAQMCLSDGAAGDSQLVSWIQVLEGFANRGGGGESDSPASLFLRTLASITHPVSAWIATAKLEDLVSLTPPTGAEVANALKSGPPDQQLFDDYRWIVDRFSTTSLSAWSTSSLHREYQWKRNEIPPPCAPGLMVELAIPQDELNREVAQRAVATEGPSSSRIPEDTMLILAEMERHAKGLLASPGLSVAPPYGGGELGWRPFRGGVGVGVRRRPACGVPVAPGPGVVWVGMVRVQVRIGRRSVARRAKAAASSNRQGQCSAMRSHSRRWPRVMRPATCSSR